MDNDIDKEVVRKAINAFYKGAGVNKTFTGKINEKVAVVFGQMLKEAKRCSDAMSWVPSPPGGPASLTWIASSFTTAMINRMNEGTSLVCAKYVAMAWSRELDRASILG